MKNFPPVTICIPAYNSEKTIRKTVRSVLGQNYPNLKIIVSDNNSGDNTEEIVKSFKDARLFYRKNILSKDCKITFAPLENCNSCFSSDLIDGKFVAFYHADDIYEKNIVEKEVEFLLKNPRVGAVFSLGKKINEKDKIIGEFKLPKELAGKNTYNFVEIFKALLKNGNLFLPTPTFMTRKEVFKKIGMFSPNFGTSCDLGTWIKIAEKYPIGILNENLFQYRAGGGSFAYNRLRTERADFFELMDYYLEKNKYSIKIEDSILRQYEYRKTFMDGTIVAMNFLLRDDIKSARKLINRPISADVAKAFFENLSFLKIKIAALRAVLFLAVNSGLKNCLRKALQKRFTHKNS